VFERARVGELDPSEVQVRCRLELRERVVVSYEQNERILKTLAVVVVELKAIRRLLEAAAQDRQQTL
jgi:hypothetical protein